MNSYKFYIIGVFSTISFVLSIITFCSFDSYDYDKTSALMSGFSIMISALAVIVAILVGIQIYNVYEIKQIKKETLDARDDVYYKSNNNLLTLFSSLAAFYTAQYISKDEDKSDNIEMETLLFSALLHWAITMDLSARLNQHGLFFSALNTATTIAGDRQLPQSQIDQILINMSSIPETWQSDDYKKLYKIIMEMSQHNQE